MSEPGRLPSAGITRPRRYYAPLRLPRRPADRLSAPAVSGREPPPTWVSHVASITVCTCRPHYPGWRWWILWSVAPPPPGGLPHMAGGSAPARNFRGLLRVHTRCSLRTCLPDLTRRFRRLQPDGYPHRLLRRLPGCTDNSPDGTPTRWPSRPRGLPSLSIDQSIRDLLRVALPPAFQAAAFRRRRPSIAWGIAA